MQAESETDIEKNDFLWHFCSKLIHVGESAAAESGSSGGVFFVGHFSGVTSSAIWYFNFVLCDHLLPFNCAKIHILSTQN